MKKEKWEIKKLGEVCIIQRGGSPRPINEYITDDENGLNWIKIGDTIPNSRYITKTAEKIKPEGLSKTRFVHRGDFLLSNSMSFGRPYILEIDGCIHDGWLVIHDKNKIFDKSFLYFLLSSPIIKSKFELMAVGGVVNNLNSTMVSNLEIPIPPLPVQEKIVSELDTLHRLKELQEQQLAELDNLAQSTFYHLFGDPIDNEKGWETGIFGDLFSLKSGTALSSKNIISGIYPVFGGNGIVGYHSEYNLIGANIIIGRVGALCGNVRLVTENLWLTDNAFNLIVEKESFNNIFLRHLLILFDLRKYAREALQPVISNLTLKGINVILPPLSLQTHFSERIERIEAQKELIKQSIGETQLLIDYTMDKYFG